MSEDFNSIRIRKRRESLTSERRLSARIDAPYPVRLRSVDPEGQRFKEETMLDNLGGGGLHLSLERELEVGAFVSLAVRLSVVPEGPSLRLAARGNITRVEQRQDGYYGVAIEFKQRRVL